MADDDLTRGQLSHEALAANVGGGLRGVFGARRKRQDGRLAMTLDRPRSSVLGPLRPGAGQLGLGQFHGDGRRLFDTNGNHVGTARVTRRSYRDDMHLSTKHIGR